MRGNDDLRRVSSRPNSWRPRAGESAVAGTRGRAVRRQAAAKAGRTGDPVQPGSLRRLAQARLVAASDAMRQLKAYRLLAGLSLLDWLRTHPRHDNESAQSYLTRWRHHWRASREGVAATAALSLRLRRYREVAARELRRVV